MGVDLTLLPNYWHLPGKTINDDFNAEMLAYASTPLTRDPDLFEHIKALPSVLLTKPVRVYTDDGLRSTKEDQYGDLLQYVEARSFAELLRRRRMRGETTPRSFAHHTSKWNRAALEMMTKLKPVTEVVLWWW